MEKLTLDLPGMYADHHTLQVRQVLLALEGVEEVYASSAWKQVMISFDRNKINPTAIEKALTEAGYSSAGPGHTDHQDQPVRHRDVGRVSPLLETRRRHDGQTGSFP